MVATANAETVSRPLIPLKHICNPKDYNTLTDQERLDKLIAAVALIREVEFSYAQDSDERSRWYCWIATHCSFIGFVGQCIGKLKKGLM